MTPAINSDNAHAMLVTITTAISAGVILIILSHKLRLPGIVLLLAGGIVLGPQFLGVVQAKSLGATLPVLVSLAVSLVLFEGGLSLDLRGYRSAPSIIRRLLTAGVLITWFTTALAIRLLFRFPASYALLAASLVIVTGPTVIAPLLKRIKIQSNLHHILHWEAVLIDPLGVFVAILCFEWIGGISGGMLLTSFVLRLAVGFLMGLAGGFGVYYLLKLRAIPEDMINTFTLACAVAIFGLTEAIGARFGFSEAGLLAVVIAGFTLGALRPLEIKAIRQFKTEITDLLIGMLFILLASRLEFEQFRSFGWRGALVVAAVIFVARPLNVLACSWGLDLSWRERGYLSWVAPRGIVAASMASLFALNLSGGERGARPEVQFVETFTYSVIISTIVLQGFTAGPLAKRLGLKRPAPTGWMIVGAQVLGRRIAHFISARAGQPVLLIDLNPRLIADAQAEGLQAMQADARERALEDRAEMQDVGNLIALTDNEDLNALLCQRWADAFGREHLFRWQTSKATEDLEAPGRIVWSSLPKPSLLSAELLQGEASVILASRHLLDPGELTIPLVALRDRQPVLDPRSSPEIPPEELGETLLLKREAEYLVRSLRPELFARLEVQSIEELFEHLLDQVLTLVPKLNRELTFKELIERERSFPTAMGHGLAVPHAYSTGLQWRTCAVAQLPGGLSFDAPDGIPVRLVLLLLSPPGDPEGHLATLAEIARVGSDARTRDQLMRASTGEEFIRIIRNFDPARQEEGAGDRMRKAEIVITEELLTAGDRAGADFPKR